MARKKRPGKRLPGDDPRTPSFDEVRQLLQDAFASERGKVIAAARLAVRDGGDVRAALSGALDAVQAGQDHWANLFTDALTSVGQSAGQRLISQWVSDGLLPDGTTYDPTRAGSLIAQAIASGSAGSTPDMAARYVVETTRDALTGKLSALIDTSGVEDIISAIESQYAAWQAGRIPTIADMQVVGGWSLGELDAAFQAQGITDTQAVRTWNTMGDDRVRTSHADADGQEVGLNEPFQVGSEQLMYPCDPSGSLAETSGCRCWVEYTLQASSWLDQPIEDTGDPLLDEPIEGHDPLLDEPIDG